jgi:hypothetical protein
VSCLLFKFENSPCSPIDEQLSNATLKNALYYEGEVKDIKLKDEKTEPGNFNLNLKLGNVVNLKQESNQNIQLSETGEYLEGLQKIKPLDDDPLMKKVNFQNMEAFGQAKQQHGTDDKEHSKDESSSTNTSTAFTRKGKLRSTENKLENLEVRKKKIEPEASPAFAKLKLKKTEQIKRNIESVALETVQLVHHDFENIPQDPQLEQTAYVILISSPFPDIERKLESTETSKGIKKKKQITAKNITNEETNTASSKEENLSLPSEQPPSSSLNNNNTRVKLKPNKPVLVEAEVIDFSSIKLKKSEIIKRSISPPEMETVELFHHEFENLPQDPQQEGVSNLIIKTEPTTVRTELDNIASKKKPAVRKVKKPQRPGEEAQLFQALSDDTVDVSEQEKSKLSPSDFQVIEVKKEIPGEAKYDPEKFKKAKKVQIFPGEGDSLSVKLKKSKTLKRQFSPPSVETVQLFHHEFENIPQEPSPEGKSKILLAERAKLEDLSTKNPTIMKKVRKSHIQEASPSDHERIDKEMGVLISDNKTPMKEKTQPEKPFQVLTAQQQERETEPEEVERKPTDPAIKLAAAIEKKHSDTERISLPAFMNFPSEQGLTVIPQESTIKHSEHPKYEEIVETVEKENLLTQNILETVPSVISTGKKKFPKKDQQTGSTALSIPIVKSTVTSETVTVSEVF